MMSSAPIEVVREAWVNRVLEEHNRRDRATERLLSAGWELVDTDSGTLLLGDGREVLHIGAKSYALPLEEHKRRRQEAIDAAVASVKKAAPQPQQPGEGLSSVLCPVCQSAMAKSPVCPNCAKGKQGFKILCQCTECSHEVYL
jgi:hypothetical protein